MSDNNQATSGAVDETSGSSEQPIASVGADGLYKAEFVAKLKKEKENASKANAELKAKLEEANLLLQQKQESELQKEKQYQQLWENEKKARAELEAQVKATKEQIKQAKIQHAVKQDLIKLGLANEYVDTAFKLIDWKLVTTDPETDSVIGSEETAKAFYQSHAALGFFKKPGAVVNHNAPAGKPGETGFQAEVKAAKTQKELDAVFRKYNMV